MTFKPSIRERFIAKLQMVFEMTFVKTDIYWTDPDYLNGLFLYIYLGTTKYLLYTKLHNRGRGTVPTTSG